MYFNKICFVINRIIENTFILFVLSKESKKSLKFQWAYKKTILRHIDGVIQKTSVLYLISFMLICKNVAFLMKILIFFLDGRTILNGIVGGGKPREWNSVSSVLSFKRTRTLIAKGNSEAFQESLNLLEEMIGFWRPEHCSVFGNTCSVFHVRNSCSDLSTAWTLWASTSHRSKKEAALWRRLLFLYTKKCSLGVFKQCSDAKMNSEHWTMNRCFPNTKQGSALDDRKLEIRKIWNWNLCSGSLTEMTKTWLEIIC